MTLEDVLARHNWAELATATGSAERVPEAIRELSRAATADEADRGYWSIDNVVVVQGTLTPAAEATADALIAALDECTAVARPEILELLVQLASGQGEPRPERAARIVDALAPIVPALADLVRYGSDEERFHAWDLLVLCAGADPAVRSRVVDLARRLRHDPVRGPSAARVLGWLDFD
jgi:hypothetical protein